MIIQLNTTICNAIFNNKHVLKNAWTLTVDSVEEKVNSGLE